MTLAESYEPYGSLLSSNGSASSIFGYSGEEADTSGLVYLRARYMQPTLGIFLARDPWSGDQLRPGSMNGWGYVEGNPVNHLDPSGQCENCGGAGTFALVTGADQDSNGKGLAVRAYPRYNSPVNYRLHDGSAVMLTNRTEAKDGVTWRLVFDPKYLGSFEEIVSNVGWVNDAYLKGGGGYGDMHFPRDATSYPPSLNFKLGPIFPQEDIHWIMTEYGEGAGYQQTYVPELDINAHAGIDIVPYPLVGECPHDDNVAGREVLAPVSGTLTEHFPDGSPQTPADNPPGRTLDIDNIPGYPRLQVKITHAYAHLTGPVNQGDQIGYFAQIGYSYGPHVHIALRWKDYDGNYFFFDPTLYLFSQP